MALFNISRWPGLLVFAMAGLAAVVFAFVTVNLFAKAMANLAFIERHGWLAIQEGALLQLGELTFWGCLALLSYLLFKACEVELVFRYFHWARRLEDGVEGKRQMRFRRKEREDT